MKNQRFQSLSKHFFHSLFPSKIILKRENYENKKVEAYYILVYVGYLGLVITYVYNKYVPHYIMLDHVKKPHVFLAIKWLSHHFLLLVFSWRDNTVSLLLYQWEPP